MFCRCCAQFYDQDKYVVAYEYQTPTSQDAVFLYLWQGGAAPKDTAVTAATLAAFMAENGANLNCDYPAQAVVEQGREPLHFYKVFNNRLVVHTGRMPAEVDPSTTADQTRLFRVHQNGTNDCTIHAAQVEATASSLAAGGVFILESPDDVRHHRKER